MIVSNTRVVYFRKLMALTIGPKVSVIQLRMTFSRAELYE